MNIERQGAGNPPRIDKSTAIPARASALDGGFAGTEGESSSFAEVLTGLGPAPRGGPGAQPADPIAQDAIAGASTSLSDPARSPADAEAVAGSVAGAPSDSRTDPAIATDGLFDVSVLRGWVPPAVPAAQPAAVSDARERVSQGPGDLRPVGLDGATRPPERPGAAAAQSVLDAQVGGVAGGAGRAPAQLPDGPAGRLARGDMGIDDRSAWVAAGGSGSGRATPEAPLADGRAILAMQAERVSMSGAPMSEAVGGGFKPLPGLSGQRSAERVAARSVFVPLEGSLAGGGAASAYSTNPAAGFMGATGAEAPFAAGASSEVAHQVHYWITRGAQNAELQLDAFGGGAVDVSISLRGNEAQVEFRSDQPEARRLLHDAMPQLRDLLQSEGLQLAGGFVGDSADPGRQQGRDDTRSLAARAGTVPAPGQTEGKATRPKAAQGHALDVFV